MKHFRCNLLIQSRKFIDIIVTFLCYLTALHIDSYPITTTMIQSIFSMSFSFKDIGWVIIIFSLWHFIYATFGLYRSKRLATFAHEVVMILKAVTTNTIISIPLFFLYIPHIFSPSLIIRFYLFSLFYMVVQHFIIKKLLSIFRCNNRNLRYILIIGTNRNAIHFSNRINQNPQYGYRIVGFVTHSAKANPQTLRSTDHEKVVQYEKLEQFLRHNVVDEIYFALPITQDYNITCKIASICEKHGIILRYNSNLFNLERAHLGTDEIEETAMIYHYFGSMVGRQIYLKRALDIIFPLILIITLSPIFLLTMLMIKCSSRGSVFFTQDRIGLNKRVFKMLKFRTMVPDAEHKQAALESFNEQSGPVFKITDDPRITPIGRFLRKTSIDELPQLFNVLKGDMSLVGPRPLPIRDYNGFTNDKHRRRLSVPPGMTCIWQISGRNNIPFEKWMEMDLQYIDRWSILLDLHIIIRTIFFVLRGTGAA